MATITLSVQQPVGIVPAGALDGMNRDFVLPTPVSTTHAAVWHNGVRLSPPDDFAWLESGPPGTGYDTIRFDAAGTPRPGDHILVDY